MSRLEPAAPGSPSKPRVPGCGRARAAAAWILFLCAGTVPATPVGAVQRAPGDLGAPYRVERFTAATPVDLRLPAPDAFQEADDVDGARVAMGTILAGVGSWIAAGFLASYLMNGYEGYYLVAPPVSILASALTAHALSGGRGDLALSLGVSAGVSALLAAGSGDLWIVAGPAAAIPISVHVETR